jgi:2-keto-4-pentenoate hydratase/2-oxohepta-3-ene-1,7-dioic acid hydratase in catechol pathway
MRLITFRRDGNERIGAWIDGDSKVVDLAAASSRLDGKAAAAFASMQALIESGPSAWDRARSIVASPPAEAVLAAKDCTLLAPLPRPAQIRDCLCFPEHLKGARRVLGEQLVKAAPDPARKRADLEAAGFFAVPKDYYNFPVYYISNRMSVVGPEVDVTWPSYSRFIDYELEWCAVIGRAGSQIAKDKARDHIFGYSIFNDWSARDEQMKVMGVSINLGPGQGKDFANGLGPCIVTADEIPDPYNLKMSARVNGEQVSLGSTSGMHYKFEDLIEYVTRGHAVMPGELFCSGTVGGGCALETGTPISPGAVIELDIERIGVLRNRVVAPHLEQAGAMSNELVGNMSSMMKA